MSLALIGSVCDAQCAPLARMIRDPLPTYSAKSPAFNTLQATPELTHREVLTMND